MNSNSMELLKIKADMLAAAGHPIRLAILEYLADGEQCVCDIAEHVGAERSNVSRHLSVMVRAGLLTQRKEGLKVMYALRCRCIVDFLACVTQTVRQCTLDRAAVLQELTK